MIHLGAYMSHIQLHPVETLIRGYAVVHPHQCPVAQVHEDCPHLCPEAWWEIQVLQHCTHAIHGHADMSFSGSIQWRWLWDWWVNLYPFMFTILIHLPSHKLLCIVKHNNLDHAPCSFLHPHHILNSAATLSQWEHPSLHMNSMHGPLLLTCNSHWSLMQANDLCCCYGCFSHKSDHCCLHLFNLPCCLALICCPVRCNLLLPVCCSVETFATI